MRFRRILAVIPAVALLVARITAEAQTAPRLGDAASSWSSETHPS
jgi:hypothetical protein